MMMNESKIDAWKDVREECERVSKRMGLVLTREQCDALVVYLQELVRWNKTYNLTAITKPHDMLVKHVFDTFAIVPFITGEHILDVGTGAGIPGLILSIVFPEKQFTLLDSNGKKTRFLIHIKGKLGLSNVTIVQERVEQYRTAKDFDLILARAFAAVSEIVRLCDHLRAPQGQYCLMKGQLNSDELATLDASYWVTQHSLQVPDLDAQRHLVIIKKGQCLE